MKYILALSTLLSGCSGWFMYDYDHGKQFRCDMDPNMQMCLNPGDLRRHIDNN